MSATTPPFLPRPGDPHSSHPPLPAPSEQSFTSTFGTLLPPAQYLTVSHLGKAAYYSLPPLTPPSAEIPTDRVLLLHGVQTPALGMLPLTRLLRSSFPTTHFVLLELWGHGLSETPVKAHTPALFHELMDALLDHLSWTSAHLIGYSFGGRLVAEYAATRPQRVRSVVVVAPAGLMRAADLSAEGKMYLRGGEDGAALKWWVEWLEGGALHVPEDWGERVGKGEIVPGALKRWQMEKHEGHGASVLSILRDGGVFDSHGIFEEMVGRGVRVKGVLGETDGICSKGDLRALGITDVDVVMGAGHGVVREREEEVAALIKVFWEKERE